MILLYYVVRDLGVYFFSLFDSFEDFLNSDNLMFGVLDCDWVFFLIEVVDLVWFKVYFVVFCVWGGIKNLMMLIDVLCGEG